MVRASRLVSLLAASIFPKALSRGARAARFAGALCALAVASHASAQQQQQTATGRATVTGVVTDATSEAPIPGATVSIPGTPFQATTDEAGRYTLRNVPMGNHTIDAKRVGYSQAHEANVRVNAANFVHNIKISQVALSLSAITTSATVDPTSGAKSPFAVATVSMENMPVPRSGVTTNLQGKVAGLQVVRSSGATGGEEPWVQIRSIQSPGNRGASPLIIVDGVPLNMVRQTNSGTTVSTSGAVGAIAGSGDAIPVRSTDIEGLDIESMEIIKGAAAAALYGSEAASGVISIKTRRGTDLGLGRSQIEVRTDYGFDQIAKMPAQRSHHQYLVNAQGQWTDLTGNVVTRANRVIDPDLMLDNDFAVLYNPVEQAFQANRTLNSTVRVSQMSERSNFQLSYTRTKNPGILKEAAGATNQGFRLNIDHHPSDNIQVSAGANYSNFADYPTSANFVTLFGFDPDVDLLASGDQFGTKYKVSPDSANPTVLNPLYLQTISGNVSKRSAAQLSANIQYRPFNWLTLVGNVGYNRQEGTGELFTPPGLPSDEAGGLTTGSLSYTEQHGDGIDAHTSATVLRDIGALTARLTGQLETTRRHFIQFAATGTNFSTVGVHSLAAATLRDNTSFQTEMRMNSGFGSLALEYGGRYVGDFLFRREGNSLYGPRSRHNNFARASGAWLMSRESWWPSSLSASRRQARYSYGTSGTQPDFNDQFEAVSVTTTGFVRGRLGNLDLLPETKQEHEMGADFIWKNRVSLALTYASSKTKNGILEVDAPNITGFNTYTRTRRALTGTPSRPRSKDSSSSVKTSVGPRRSMSIARTPSWIRTGGRATTKRRSSFSLCDGVPITQYWGSVVMRDKAQLPASRAKTLNAWEVNDEGYLVPVGVGNHWYEGKSKKLWGTTVIIDGITYNWGVPQPAFDDATATVLYAPIGDWTPTSTSATRTSSTTRRGNSTCCSRE